MEDELDEAGRRLLAFLAGKLPGAIPDDPRTFVGYKAVHDEMGLPQLGPWGHSLEIQGLASLAGWAFRNNKPAITGLVIDTGSMMPGNGYFRVYGLEHSNTRLRWWAEQIKESKSYDWTPYVAPSLTTPAAVDEVLPAPAERGAGKRFLESANVWRLVAHHEQGEEALAEMLAQNILAVGWSDVGDLRKLEPASAKEISESIPNAYPDLANAQLGGPSLWNLFRLVKPGDLVIVTIRSSRKCVFEVTGEYRFAEGDGVLGYRHLRPATVTSLDADELWQAVGADVAIGQNIRWTLACCTHDQTRAEVQYTEGERYEVRSTAIERNPAARAACLAHFGHCCAVCGFDFAATFGEIGEGYIHVHHRRDLCLSDGPTHIDPVRDLIPLCPNCHAMVHRVKPSMEVQELVRRRNGVAETG